MLRGAPHPQWAVHVCFKKPDNAKLHTLAHYGLRSKAGQDLCNEKQTQWMNERKTTGEVSDKNGVAAPGVLTDLKEATTKMAEELRVVLGDARSVR